MSTLEAMMNISEEEQNSTRYNINGEASISIEHSEIIEGDRVLLRSTLIRLKVL
ncbi:hypothetical protein J14TS2_22720 [Bacillus sp. J14TS2]|nr:hypothetical protein J14TS2_22720 [Bacillus sp. J14TS2]